MILVRYTVKPDQTPVNASLVRAVFTELEAVQPAGLSYEVYVDGDTFFHVADGEGLTSLPSFQAFLEGHGERCVEPPVIARVERVGAYVARPITSAHRA